MTYTRLALYFVAATVLLDVVLMTGLLRRKLFWASYAVLLVAQLAVNGVLTCREVVTYAPDTILGTRFACAPVEDLLFGFALVAQTLIWWVWLGRMANRRAGRRRGAAEQR